MTQKPHPMLEKLRAKQAGLNVPTRAPRRYQTAEEHDARMEAKGRLPNLSAYSKWYDAESGLWHGQLIVWVNGESYTFTAHSPGSFRLEHRLDDLYREWLLRKGQGQNEVDEVAGVGGEHPQAEGPDAVAPLLPAHDRGADDAGEAVAPEAEGHVRRVRGGVQD